MFTYRVCRLRKASSGGRLHKQLLNNFLCLGDGLPVCELANTKLGPDILLMRGCIKVIPLGSLLTLGLILLFLGVVTRVGVLGFLIASTHTHSSKWKMHSIMVSVQSLTVLQWRKKHRNIYSKHTAARNSREKNSVTDFVVLRQTSNVFSVYLQACGPFVYTVGICMYMLQCLKVISANIFSESFPLKCFPIT
jgi:hypothetical protein